MGASKLLWAVQRTTVRDEERVSGHGPRHHISDLDQHSRNKEWNETKGRTNFKICVCNSACSATWIEGYHARRSVYDLPVQHDYCLHMMPIAKSWGYYCSWCCICMSAPKRIKEFGSRRTDAHMPGLLKHGRPTFVCICPSDMCSFQQINSLIELIKEDVRTCWAIFVQLALSAF